MKISRWTGNRTPAAKKQVGAIVKALKGAKRSTSPPTRIARRSDLLARPRHAGDKKALKGIAVRRISFNEITRGAIRERSATRATSTCR